MKLSEMIEFHVSRDCPAKEDLVSEAVVIEVALKNCSTHIAAAEKLIYHAEQQGQFAIPLSSIRDALGIK